MTPTPIALPTLYNARAIEGGGHLHLPHVRAQPRGEGGGSANGEMGETGGSVGGARALVADTGAAVAAAPVARSWNGILLLQPGITGDPGQVQLVPSMIIFGGHGGPIQEGRLLVDGMNVGASRGGGGVSGYTVDTGNLQEITFRSSGGLGEAETGGPYMNVIPKTGGNTFHGSFVESFSNRSLQDSNYTDQLKAKGLRVPGQLLKLYDHDAALGGPIKKDRLWFYGIVRYLGQQQ